MFRRLFRCLPVLVLGLTASGCESLFSLDGNPRLCDRQPSMEALTEERVIVRVNELAGARHRLYLDRVRYLDRGDSLNIDRIVIATPGELRATVEELNIERGDTLRVSTDFDSFVRSGGYEAFIPRWSAHQGRCWNGAWVSLHTLTKVEAAR